MTSKSVKFFIVAGFLTASFFIFQSFKKAPKDISNGGGVAGEELYFNFNVVENKKGISGHFSWGDTSYEVLCIYKNGNTATIYLSEGMAVNVVDNKFDDWITAPFAAPKNCTVAAVNSNVVFAVTAGNLIVHK
jgi:hypothetical protein